MKKFLALLLAVLMVVSLFAGCAAKEAPADAPAKEETKEEKKEEPKEEVKEEAKEEVKEEGFTPREIDDGVIDVLFCNTLTSAEVWTRAAKAMNELFTDDMSLTVIGPSDTPNVEKQLAELESSLATGEYDVVILYVDQFEPFQEVKKTAEAAGVPIISWCQNASGLGTYYYGDTPADRGNSMAELIQRYVDEHPEYYDQFDKIQVGVIADTNSIDVMKRVDRVIEVLEGTGKYECAEAISAALNEEGVTGAEQAVTANPDTRIILSGSMEAGLGAAVGLKNMNMTASGGYAVFGFDCTPVAVEEMLKEDSPLIGAVATTPYNNARAVTELIHRIFNGECEYGEVNLCALMQVTLENGEEYLKN